MATRSSITVRMTNGLFKTVYCHYDGNLKHNGKVLLQYYNSQSKAEMLVAYGDISFIDENGIINPYSKSDTKPATAHSVYESLIEGVRTQEYNYLWQNGMWHVRYKGSKPSQYEPLTQSMTEYAKVTTNNCIANL